MKYPPLSFAPALFQAVDCSAAAHELLATAQADAEGKAARTLFKSAELTVVLSALRAGAELSEHAARGPTLIVPVIGHVTFDTPSPPSDVALGDQKILGMGPGLRHAVRAAEDTAFLIVIGARPATS